MDACRRRAGDSRRAGWAAAALILAAVPGPARATIRQVWSLEEWWEYQVVSDAVTVWTSLDFVAAGITRVEGIDPAWSTMEREGNSEARLSRQKAAISGGQPARFWLQEGDVPALKKYGVAVSVADASTGASPQSTWLVSLALFGRDQRLLGEVSVRVPDAESWDEYEGYFEERAGARFLAAVSSERVYSLEIRAEGSRSFVIDDLLLAYRPLPVPEPSTTVLGLAGLALLAIRRYHHTQLGRKARRPSCGCAATPLRSMDRRARAAREGQWASARAISVVAALSLPPAAHAAPQIQSAPRPSGPWRAEAAAQVEDLGGGLWRARVVPAGGEAMRFYRPIIEPGIAQAIGIERIGRTDPDAIEMELRLVPWEPTLTVLLPGGAALDLVLVPAGSFWMGSPETEWGHLGWEEPRHEVRLGRPFYMGRCEVTQRQWLAVMGRNPSRYWDWGLEAPVEKVSWYDCQEFVARLTGLGKGRFRLPSEAEWEYACRAGTTTAFYFGESNTCAGWTDCAAGTMSGQGSEYLWWGWNTPAWERPGRGSKPPQPVGQKLPNAWGLHDMHGNVYEWVQDDWHETYTGAPADGFAWMDQPAQPLAVFRGGCCQDKEVEFARSGFRTGREREFYMPTLGLRVVREADSP